MIQKYGGISRYFYEIIKRNTGCCRIRAEVCAGFFKNNYGLEKLSNKYLTVFGWKFPEHPKTGYIWRVLKYANKALFNSWYMLRKNKYDIYHPTYYHTEKRRFMGRTVVTVYDMIHELYPQLFRENDPTSKAKKQTVKNADMVIAISESTKRDLVNILDIDQQKVRVIHLASSLVHDPFCCEAIINEPYILYIGNRRGYKNFSSFIKAYASNREVSSDFRVVVFGGEKITQDDRNMFEDLRIYNHVKQIFGDDTVLSNLYQNAACFIYPSLYEGFGIPPLEAMHYGCPVIASNTSSIPEVVGDAGILFNPCEMEEISYALEKVLYDEELKANLITKGYQRKNNFSWEKCARETYEIYSQLSM